MSDLDPHALRDAFGCFMTGVTVVTTVDASGTPLGFTANSFSSVSLDPPLLLVSIAKKSSNIAAFEGATGFAVNILAEGQKDISATFARPVEDRFASVYWRRGPVGSPLLAGVSAWFDCTMAQAVDAGDHVILIGRVGGFEATPAPGLGYYRGTYITPAETAARLPTGPNVVISAILQCEGQILLTGDTHGGLALPMAVVGREGVQAALGQLIAKVGRQAEPGSIYAVYEDVAQGAQHIAFRCPTKPGKPNTGCFVDLSPEGVRVRLRPARDPAAAGLLRRPRRDAADPLGH